MVEGFNATQRELEILELRKEVSALKTNVEYWRLAAERRDTRKELTGLDVPEARTLDAPEPPQCEVQTAEPVAWRWCERPHDIWRVTDIKPFPKTGRRIEPLYAAVAQNQKTRCENCNLLARCDDPLCPNGVAQARPEPDYIRNVLANNLERCADVLWDLENKSVFDKNDGQVLGVIAVCQQIQVSLTALMVDVDNAPAQAQIDPGVLSRLRRWRDVGDGPISYCAGGSDFAADVTKLVGAFDTTAVPSAERS